VKAKPFIVRQGDVALIPVAALPEGCTHIEPENGMRFVLAFGESSGHAHALYEFTDEPGLEREAVKFANATGFSALASPDAPKVGMQVLQEPDIRALAFGRAEEMATAALERARTRRTAQMWVAPDGEWYLEVRQPSMLKHEEHSAATLPVGIYHCPVQVEAGPQNMTRIVAD